MPNQNSATVTVRMEWWLQIILDELARSRLRRIGLIWIVPLGRSGRHGIRLVQSAHTRRFLDRRRSHEG